MAYNLQLFKPFPCPSCNQNFGVKDFSRPHIATRFPLILPCGNTVCEICIKQQGKFYKKIKCPICEKETDLPEGEGSSVNFIPDIYMLGMINMRQKTYFPRVKLKPSISVLQMQPEKNTEVQCDECSKNSALWICDMCAASFCSICFDKIHSESRIMKRHQSRPIHTNEYRSKVQAGCKNHPEKSVEFYCEDDDELVCSFCVVMGSHKGHIVTTLSDKNINCAEKIKEKLEIGQKILSTLKYTERKLKDIIPGKKNSDVSSLIAEAQVMFHKLYTTLLLRETEMLIELEAAGNCTTVYLTEMYKSVSDNEKLLETVMKDAREVLTNPYGSLNAVDVIKQLDKIFEMPRYLVPNYDVSEESEEPKFGLIFEEGVTEILKNYGKVECSIVEKYSLKRESELPCDFQIEIDDDDKLSAAETESISSIAESPQIDISPQPSSSQLFLPPALETLPVNAFFPKMSVTPRHQYVTVSHIRSPNYFWIQLYSDLKSLSILMDQIRQVKPNERGKVCRLDKVKKGFLCLAMYSQDNRWYRAQVKNVITKGMLASSGDNTEINPDKAVIKDSSDDDLYAEVLYVDYGNVEVIPINRLREIPMKFTNKESFAKLCSLFDVVPRNSDVWSIESINAFAAFVRNKKVIMKVIEQRNGIFYVDLSHPASLDIDNDIPMSVRDALVFLEHGNFAFSEAKQESPKKVKRQFHPADTFSLDIKVNVVLSHIVNPYNFHVQQLGGTAKRLTAMLSEMQRFYNRDPNQNYCIIAPKIGMMCACKYTLDEQWYRAEIIGLPGGSQVEVQYVDFGNTEILDHSNLRKLANKFAVLNKQAILCSLADVAPIESWSEKEKDWLIQVAGRKYLTLENLKIIPGEHKANVALYTIEDNYRISINTKMVEEGLALSTGPASKIPLPTKEEQSKPEVKPIIINSERTTVVDKMCSEKESSSQKSFFITLSHVESPDCIFIQLADNEQNALERLMIELQKVYENSEFGNISWKENDHCVAQSQQDFRWYRAQITKKIDESEFEVHMLDYGFKEIVELKDLKILLNEYQKDSFFAAKCHLAGITPTGGSENWSRLACEFVKNFAKSDEHKLYCSKLGESENGSYPVDILVEEIKGGALEPTVITLESISQKIIENGLALPCKNYIKDKEPSPGRIECNVGIIPSKSTSENHNSVQVIQKSNVHNVSPAFSWLPAVYPKVHHMEVLPTYVDDDGFIYVHPVDDKVSALKTIETALQTTYSKLNMDKPKDLPIPQQACVAKFSLNKQWYRAEVVQTADNIVQVMFIDYGNTDFVPLEDICMHITLKNIPRQCLKCKLYGIKPKNSEDGNWPEDVLTFVHSTIVEKRCTMKIEAPPKYGKYLNVSLSLQTSTEEIDLAELLVQMDNAIFEDSNTSALDSSTLQKTSNKKVVTSKESLDERKLDKSDEDVVCNSNAVFDNANEAILSGPVKLEPELHLRNGEKPKTVDKILNNIRDVASRFSQNLVHTEDKEDSNSESGESISNLIDGNPEEHELFMSVFTPFDEPTNINIKEPFPVVVTQIIDLTTVYLQRLKFQNPKNLEQENVNIEYDKFLKLMDDLANSSVTEEMIENPYPGMACCAQYSHDNNWYRCVVTNVLEDNKISVIYVDYGNSEVTSIDRLRQISSDLIQFPIQAHRCKLHGISTIPKHLTKALTNMMDILFQEKSTNLYARVIKGEEIPVEIDLLVKESTEDENQMPLAYQSLINLGLITKC